MSLTHFLLGSLALNSWPGDSVLAVGACAANRRVCVALNGLQQAGAFALTVRPGLYSLANLHALAGREYAVSRNDLYVHQIVVLSVSAVPDW